MEKQDEQESQKEKIITEPENQLCPD